MKISITSDLHFDVGKPDFTEVRRQIEGSDVFVIAGDIGGPDKESWNNLNMFSDFPGKKLCVPGNHDLYVREGSSHDKYRRFIVVAATYGFHVLDYQPIVVNRVGFAGNIGWYDYSFRDRSLTVPRSFYRDKKIYGMPYWNDGQFIKGIDDKKFSKECIKRAKNDLDSLQETDKIVFVTHHLPFEDFVVKKDQDWNLGNAFMGSRSMGEMLKNYQKRNKTPISHVFFGHSHRGKQMNINGMECYNIGSTYRTKEVVTIDL